MPDFDVVRRGMRQRGLTTCQQWCDVMLSQAKVAVRQRVREKKLGKDRSFYFPSQLMPSQAFLRPEGELTTRLCFVDFDGAAAMAALQAGEDASREESDRAIARGSF